MSGPVDLSHLKPFETAARIYCSKVGVDAEARVPRPHPELAGVVITVRMWEVAAEELIDLSRKLTSLKEASEAAQKIVLDS